MEVERGRRIRKYEQRVGGAKGEEMKTKMLVLAALLCCMSAVVSAQTVYVNSSPNATFSAYHTYAWGQNQNPNQVANSFLAQEAQTQINTQLQNKGLKLVQETENPDLVVIISGGMKTQTSYNAWGMRGFGGGMGGITPEQNVIGTLIVDIYDVKAKELAWRGMAQNTLNESNSQKNMKMVDNAVAKMFKKYPSS
jgi:opacity protein-like surface antigen